jgi:galactose mutarotase-like enzyme
MFGKQFKDQAVAIYQTEVSADGFDLIRLSNSCLSVSIMPQLGGKIYEIVDLRSGRDWLWKNPHIALSHPSPGMNYDRDHDTGGWDEILFSVKPCTLDLPDGNRLSIGDHGIAVDRPWRNIEAGVNTAGEAICELLADGQSPHFKLTRRLVLDAGQASFSLGYKLTNTGQVAWPWLWCAHPLFAIENGMHIRLLEGQQLRLLNDDETSPVINQIWPDLALPGGGSINLAGIFEEPAEPETFCQKLFVRSAGKFSLCTGNGRESFSMVYNPESLPWLGLWLNKNAWSGCDSEPYLNLGMEPATAPHDLLSDAVEQGCADFLQAGESRDWSLSVNLINTVDTHD